MKIPSAPVSRLVLVSAPRAKRDDGIRRYRLARLKLDRDARARREDRFAHLRRAYD